MLRIAAIEAPLRTAMRAPVDRCDATSPFTASPSNSRASGSTSQVFARTHATSYIGVELFHQWAVFDPANPLGIVVSEAGRAWLGT